MKPVKTRADKRIKDNLVPNKHRIEKWRKQTYHSEVALWKCSCKCRYTDNYLKDYSTKTAFF